jgi:hypothetical protein
VRASCESRPAHARALTWRRCTGLTASEIELLTPEADGRVELRAKLHGVEDAVFIFRLERREIGSKRGCWLTKQLLPAGSKYL